MTQLDPRQTSCFLVAVQTGTVRAAAEQIGLEPSTVSRNISALETALSTTLIERGRSGVRPTESGVLLVAYLKRQTGELDLLRSEFDALAQMKRGKVAIAVGEGFVGDLFDGALARFSAKYPDITFAITVGSTEHVMQQILSEQAHLGLAYNVPKTPQIRVETSASQPLVALVRRGGIYDRTEPLNLASLAKMPCAIPPKTFGIGAMITAVEAKHGIRLRAIVETGSIAALKAFVRNDMGFTILPRFVVENELSSGMMNAHQISSSIFAGGVSSMLRKEGRKLPQAADLLLKQMKKMSAFT
ncbi:MAG: LysR family transcriptional regulator [Rhodobacteraceae bacterium]|nr:LysR family transcriptional regulator [Paracoccaceae bacterium]